MIARKDTDRIMHLVNLNKCTRKSPVRQALVSGVKPLFPSFFSANTKGGEAVLKLNLIFAFPGRLCY